MKLAKPFSRLSPGKALVLGDLMYDTYTIGSVKRISPEAPVPVMQVHSEEGRAGGAGNVALSLMSLGMEVKVVGRVGNDVAGVKVKTALSGLNIDVRWVVVEGGYRTAIKNRIIAGNQQLVRIDHEEVTPLPKRMESRIIRQLPELLEDVQVVAISDYLKGFLSPTLLKAVIVEAKKRGIPVIVDPKGHDFSKYRGATLIKPNLSEAKAAARLSTGATLGEIAEQLFRDSQAELILVTRSENGISLFTPEGEHRNFPVKVREIQDVTGAGDTVLAILACCYANKLSIEEAAELSNVAAGIAVEHLGCTYVTLAQLARRLLEYDIENKVFEEEHIFALKQLLAESDPLILGVNSGDGLTKEIFSSIHRLAKSHEGELIVYIRDKQPDMDFVKMISTLKEVDFIVLKNNSLKQLSEHILPKEVYVLENGELLKHREVEAILA